MKPTVLGRRLAVRALLALAALSATHSAVAAAEAAELARRFPPGALGYAETSSLGDVLERLLNSTYWLAVASTPQARQVQASPEFRKALAARELAERQLGLDLQSAATRLLGNRVAVAVYPPVSGPRPDVLVIVEAADEELLPLVRRRLDPLLVLAEDQLRLSQGIDGWEQLSADDKLFVAWKGRWLVASGRRERVDEAIARIAGKEPGSLAEDETFRAMLQAVGEVPEAGSRPLLVFADTARINKLLGGKAIPEKLDNPLGSLLFGDAVARAGRSRFAGLTVDLRARGASARLTLGDEGGALGEAFAAFTPKTSADGVQPLPAAGRIGGWTIYRDFAGWYAHRAQLLQDQVLPGFDKFESGLANLLPNRDFGQDVLPLFGKRLTFVSAPQTYEHLDGQPGVKLPGFALVVELAQPEEATALLQLFFQTLTAILNLEAGQQGRQPWVVATEIYRDVPISYAKYLKKPTGERLGLVFNFLPASARVGDRFVFSSSLDLCKQLIDDLRQPGAAAAPAPRTISAELRLAPLADLIEANREFFVGRLVQEGRTTAAAEEEFTALVGLLRRLEAVELHTESLPEAYRVELEGTWK